MLMHALVIEAEGDHRRWLRDILHNEGWQVGEACSAAEAIEIIDQHPWALVFCDTDLNENTGGRGGGSTILTALRERLGTRVYIVMMGAGGRPHTALEAIVNGASDYFRKPCTPSKIRECAQAVMQRLRSTATETSGSSLIVNQSSANLIPAEYEMVGESEEIVRVYRELVRSVSRDSASNPRLQAEGIPVNRAPTYFITGETGTGKELMAHLIHRLTRQARGPFVPINCSTLPPDLAEAELFGYEQGAFTGAVRAQPGLWEAASGGTLFLDEITEAPAALQPKLLRVLQDGSIKRLGSRRYLPVDVQVIAASNRHLPTEIRTGRLRRDLYHRLSLYKLHLPPLRERRADIPLLVAHFASRHSARPVRFSHTALQSLQAHAWPGNVRELENVVRAVVTESPDGTVYDSDVLRHLETSIDDDESTGEDDFPQLRDYGATATALAGVSGDGLEERVNRFKLQVVMETLACHKGNITRTAHALKISRPSLYRLLKELEGERASSGAIACRAGASN